MRHCWKEQPQCDCYVIKRVIQYVQIPKNIIEGVKKMEKKSPKESTIEALDEEDLDQVTGGDSMSNDGDLRCPLCGNLKEKGICVNLRCRNYGSYC